MVLFLASGELSYPSLPTVQAQIHEPKTISEYNKDVDVNDVNLLTHDDFGKPF